MERADRGVPLIGPSRRRSLLVVAAVVALAGLGVAAVAATRPDDRKPPTDAAATDVSATVEKRTLELVTVARGAIETVDEVAVVAPARQDGQTASVLSAAPAASGASVSSGATVAEINGRPIVALNLAVPLYRDVVPGTAGPDVVALQDALRSLGFGVDDDRGVFGEASQAAVLSLFERLGYEPAYVAGSRAAFDAGVAAAQRAAQDALDAANRSRAQGVVDPALDAAYRVARDAVGEYQASQGVMVRSSEVVRVPQGSLVVTGSVPAAGDSFEVGAMVLTLASPKPTVRLQVSPAQVSGVHEDSVVELSGSGITTTCLLGPLVPASLPTPTGADGAPSSAPADGGGSSDAGANDGGSGGAPTASETVEFDLRCEQQPGLDRVGANLVATVRTVVAGEGLVVPATALVARSDGSTAVQVVDADGTSSFTPVDVLAEAGGFVAIAAPSGDLAEGAQVRVARS